MLSLVHSSHGPKTAGPTTMKICDGWTRMACLLPTPLTGARATIRLGCSSETGGTRGCARSGEALVGDEVRPPVPAHTGHLVLVYAQLHAVRPDPAEGTRRH